VADADVDILLSQIQLLELDFLKHGEGRRFADLSTICLLMIHFLSPKIAAEGNFARGITPEDEPVRAARNQAE
jgi:hypothetical protein